MSKTKTKIEIYKELKRINAVIDRKIIKGISYAAEARRHKVLLRELRNITGRRWLPHSFRFLSFLF